MPRDARHMSEILQAIQQNNIHEVRFIYERMRKKEKLGFMCLPDPSEKARDAEGAVLAATRLKDSSILKYMLENGAKINFVSEPALPVKPTRVSPLHVAVSGGLTDNAALLLDYNADVNKPDHHGRTPLHLAVKKTDCEMTRMILSRGANVNQTDNNGYTPLQIASKFGHVELTRILLEYNAQVFNKDQKGPSPIHLAAMHGHVPLIDIFSHYVDINMTVPCAEEKQKAPLHLTSGMGNIETARFMVERFGADVNSLDSDDQTPLHCVLAERHDHRRMRRKEDFDLLVDLFIKKGTFVNHQNKAGDTALHLAARNQFYKAVEYLLANNADYHLLNKKHETARDAIPDYDLPMKQLFAKYGIFSTPYSNRKCIAPSSPTPTGSVRSTNSQSSAEIPVEGAAVRLAGLNIDNESGPSAPTG